MNTWELLTGEQIHVRILNKEWDNSHYNIIYELHLDPAGSAQDDYITLFLNYSPADIAYNKLSYYLFFDKSKLRADENIEILNNDTQPTSIKIQDLDKTYIFYLLKMLLKNSQIDIKLGKQFVSNIAEQLFCLLDNLLKWTKSNMGIQTTMPQRFIFDETIVGVTEVLLPTAKLKDVVIQLQLQHNIEIRFDVDIMKSILRNLIINAIKFSHQSGRILITLRAEDKWAILEVTDHGVGISREKQELLRERMYGMSSIGTAREDGTGLGLWIVQHFVTTHQGEFYFSSKEGEGSCFGFKIPRILPDE